MNVRKYKIWKSFAVLVGFGVAAGLLLSGVTPQLFSQQDTPKLLQQVGEVNETTGSRFSVPLENRLELLSSMDPMELDVLRRRKLKFEQLTSSQREQVRNFHEELTRRNDGAELRVVMHRYYNWLKSLDEKTQTELLDLPTEDRLKRIKSIREEQAKASFGRVGSTKLPEVDEAWVYEWIKQTATKKKDRIDELLNRRDIKVRLPRGTINVDKPARSAGARNHRFQLLAKVAPEYAEELVFEEIDELRAGLSKAALEIVDQYPPEAQKELALQWFFAAYFAQNTVSDVKLYQYWQSLSEEEQEQFEDLPRSDWRSQLEKRYFHKLRRERSGVSALSRPASPE